MMKPEIFTSFVQGSPEWFEARRGIPTASRFSSVLASGKGGAESKMRRTYLHQLAGEIITGEPMKTYSNADMDRGKAMEPEALADYQYMRNVEIQRVGFVKGYRCGASPDGFVGDDGMVEFKTTEPHLLIDILRNQEAPPNHFAQCQGNMLVAQRKWIDLCIYWPKLPMFIIRYTIEPRYCSDLEGQIFLFNKELDAIVEQIRVMS